MKKIGIAILVTLNTLTMYAQDDRYYQNNNSNTTGSDDVYTGDTYTDQQYDQSPTTYQTFYSDLNPYGNWIQTPSYGYVWVPGQAGAGFQPYMTDGHWEYTGYGWTWVSDFAWGWAPFHYGRWYMDPAYGWVWMPGAMWAPAWVTWGQYEGYYCWAPLGPGEYATTHYGGRDHNWYFTQQNHIVDHDLSSHVVSSTVVSPSGGSMEPHIIHVGHINTLDGAAFYTGPKLKEVEKEAGRSIARVSIAPAPKPAATTMSNGTISIYRPAIRPAERRPEVTNPSADPAIQRNNTTAPERQSQPAGAGSYQRDQPGRQMDRAPERQNTTPAQIQRIEPGYQRAEPVQRAPQNGGYAPAARPASPPQPQIHIEAPASRPAPARIGGPRR